MEHSYGPPELSARSFRLGSINQRLYGFILARHRNALDPIEERSADDDMLPGQRGAAHIRVGCIIGEGLIDDCSRARQCCQIGRCLPVSDSGVGQVQGYGAVG